ncbi:MAG: CcmD family protein [Terriglobia bacterium]
MTDPNDKFLFLAYGLVWIVFVIYAWVITRRQSKLRRELDELKSKAEESQSLAKPR